MPIYEFTIKVVGQGDTEQAAWNDDAREAADQKIGKGTYDEAVLIEDDEVESRSGES